ncbi:AraC family transcriptional regulator [Niabella ginsenosidivorans]|nr:helix-turn-helix domain-containing protein [Niabella ginsenosidivorans]
MNPQVILPDKQLTEYIQHFLVYETKNKQASTHISVFPDGHPGIIFFKGDNGIYQTPPVQQPTCFYISGQNMHPTFIKIPGRFIWIAAKLRPYALKNMFAITSKEIGPYCMSIEQDFPAVLAKLNDAKNSKAIIRILQQFIKECTNTNGHKIHEIVKKCTQLIIKKHGTISMKELREAFNLSERTLQRYFLAEMGIPPKRFARIIHFHYAFQTLTTEDQKRIADIAYEKGFADPAHFSRTIKRFTGQSPTGFLLKRRSL